MIRTIIAAEPLSSCWQVPLPLSKQPGQIPGRQQEVYVGAISKFGLDVDATARSLMVWGYAETVPR